MKKVLFFLLPILTGLLIFGCKKNDMGGTPVITNVRSLDTTARDSSFTEAMPGQLIVIQGHNMGGLQAVYFNGEMASFNPVYATGSNVIITIPSTAQTVATKPDASNKIRLVTNHGTAVYDFKLYLAPPYISAISFNDAGTEVVISGGNFEGVEKVTFPGNLEAPSFTVDTSYKKITVTIPSGNTPDDSIRVYCTFGQASFPYPPPMTVASVSNENASEGAVITITGTNFIGIDKVVFPGNIESTDIQPVSVSRFRVTVPSGITTTDSLKVVGALGEATAPYLFDSWLNHPSPGYISTFEVQWGTDNTSYTGWTATYHTAPNASYPNSSGSFVSFTGDVPKSGSYNWWWSNAMNMQSNSIPWVADPSTAKASDYVLKFEAYVNFDWKSGGVYFTTNSSGGNYIYEWAPWQTATKGVYHPSGWVTVTVPLTAMRAGSYDAATFWQYDPSGDSPSMVTDLTGSTGADKLVVYATNFTGEDISGMDIGFDNFRIVKDNTTK